MKFVYKAMSKEGKPINGTFEGPDKEALVAALTRQGAKPVLIRLASESDTLKSAKKGKIFHFFKKLSKSRLKKSKKNEKLCKLGRSLKGMFTVP